MVNETPTAIVVDSRSLVEPDGAHVTVLRFHAGQVRYDLHDGSQDPPSGSTALPAVAGNAVTPTERPALLAAFNGGFKASTGAGGFEVDGHVLDPLVNGDASLVIDSSGAARIGVWDQTVPTPGESVASVRQNLVPLISNGQISPRASIPSEWGAILGPRPYVARSALGEDAQGNLLYAASMAALPADLADALQPLGVVTAMELDINPYWVQADVAIVPGGPLSAAVPGQNRPAGQYLSGWTRDFVVVLASGGGR